MQLGLAVAIAGIGACTSVSSIPHTSSSTDTVTASDSAFEDTCTYCDDISLNTSATMTGYGMGFAPTVPTHVHPSLISFVAKMGAKRVSKGTLKNFIKSKIKEPLSKLKDRKLAKELAEEADRLLDILDDPWWSTAVGFIPIVGDALDLARVPAQARKALGRARALEGKVQAALHAEHKARRAAPAARSVARYVAPRESFKDFPDLVPVRFKTPVQGGGKLRRRWKDKDGNIYEWDSQHGRLEKYDRRGRHLGEFDPDSGMMNKGSDSTRKIEP